MHALGEPMTVLRATAWPAWADEPYGPIVRAIGPTLRALPIGELADLLGPAAPEVVRLMPDLAPVLDVVRPTAWSGGGTAPERRQARTLEGILGLLGRLGERRPVVLALEDLHRADAATRALVTFLSRISRDQRLAIVGTHQPDVVGRDDPWMADLEAIRTGPRPAERVVLAPLERDELAALIEGIEGERASASLLLLVAERSGGLPLVTEELLAARRELPSASLSGSFDELIIARLAIRSRECRRVLRLMSLAERPLTARAARRRGRRLRRRQRPGGAALHHRSADGRGRPRCGPVGRLGGGAGRAASSSKPMARSRSATSRSAGRSRATCCRSRGRAITPRSPRHSAGRRRRSRGTGSRRTTRTRPGRPPSRPPVPPPSDTRPPTSSRRSRPRCRCPKGRRPGAGARRRSVPPSDRVDLEVRASEAAFAVGRIPRATAFLEAAIAGLDARRDRVRLGLLHERLAQVRRAGGDPAGAMLAARRAVELVPREPSPERATVLAGLAQLKMLDGMFSDAQRLAREAIRVARACDPPARAQEVHATTTLAVALGWGSDPAAAIELLRESEAAALELDDPDALFRARANLTTVLDLVNRRAEAVEVAYRGIEDARRAGLEAVYGNFLAGNVVDTLFFLGRWPEVRAMSLRAMSWLSVGVVHMEAVLVLAAVEIETDAGEMASRLLGQTVLELAAVREPQLAGPYYLAAASFALWRGDIADASRSVDRGLGQRPRDRGVGPRGTDGRDGRAGRRGHRRRGTPQPPARAAGGGSRPDGEGRGGCHRRGPRERYAPSRPGRVAWRRPHWRRRGPTSGARRGTTPPMPGAASPRAGPSSRRPMTRRWRAGARPRRSCRRRAGRVERRRRRRCWPRWSSRCVSRRGRSCASWSSSRAGHGSSCRRGVGARDPGRGRQGGPRRWHGRCVSRRRAGTGSTPVDGGTAGRPHERADPTWCGPSPATHRRAPGSRTRSG